jgi:hypothetical protein
MLNACQIWTLRSTWNIENDSVILESWTLETQVQEYYVDSNGGLHQDKDRYLRETTKRSRSDIELKLSFSAVCFCGCNQFH